MIAATPLFFAFFAGFFLVSNILGKSTVRSRTLLNIALAFPAGFATISWLLFWSYVCGGRNGKIVFYNLFFLTATSLFLWQIKKWWRTNAFYNFRRACFSRPTLPSGSAFNTIFLLVAVTCFAVTSFEWIRYFLTLSLQNINGGWDAAYVWNLKAKFYFRSPEEWHRIFLAIMNSYHPEYPLMLSGSVAWAWIWTGKEFLAWPPMVAFLFHSSLVLLIVWYVGSYVSWVAAFLAASIFLVNPIYQFWSVTQYADVPLCFFITAATALLITALRYEEKNLFLLAGGLAGIAAWTKNEGLLFVGWTCVLLMLILWFSRKLYSDQKKSFATHYAIGFLPALLAALYVLLVLAKSGDFVGSGRSISDYFTSLFGSLQKTILILKSFAGFMFKLNQWNFLWVLFVLAIAYALIYKRDRIIRNYGWIFCAMAVAVQFGYFVIIHLSKYDLKFQIETALIRLLLHSGVLALLFVFETFASPKRTELPHV